MCLWIVVFMALRIVRLFWWHAKQFVCPPPPSLSFPLSLFIPSLSVLLSKICHIKKNTQRQKQHERNLQQWINSLARAPRESKRKRAQRTALPTPKEFCARIASALLGCCCCCWSLRTATAAAAVQFCFQRRHDWTRALQESRSRTLNSTQLSSTTTLCVCVSLCTRVCAYVSRCCVCPSRQCRKKL